MKLYVKTKFIDGTKSTRPISGEDTEDNIQRAMRIAQNDLRNPMVQFVQIRTANGLSVGVKPVKPDGTTSNDLDGILDD